MTTQTMKRWYVEDGRKGEEIITWLLAGTGTNDIDDPRNRPVPGLVGLWFYLSGRGVAYEFTPSDVIPPDSEYWGVYGLPLRKGLKLISEKDYLEK